MGWMYGHRQHGWSPQPSALMPWKKYFWTAAASCSGKILQVTLACDIQAAFYKCAPSSSAQREQMSCVIGVQGLLHLSLLLH